MEEKKKVAIHLIGWETKEGWVCRRWGQYHVIVGANPCGPRGGRCGNYEAGRDAAGYRFRSRKDAEAWGKRFAENAGYEYIG